MTRIALTVNGKPVDADVAPRTHLADFLREQLLLTGTHIGCEHGICGACTVEIDGEIARSCITYAVACDGADVRTIEGFDDDAADGAACARPSREAHALQCGYCTPGMLIAARDLVRRKRGLSRAEIRTEMSGNLCRCTGYMGIVDAIERVMAETHVSRRRRARRRPGAAPPGLARRQRPVRVAMSRTGTAQAADRSRPAPGSTSPQAARRATAARGTQRAPDRRHGRRARGGRRRDPPHARASCCRIRAMPSGRSCRTSEAVARCMPGLVARRPAAGRQGRRPPRGEDRADHRELRRRGHDPAVAGRLPPGHRGPRRRPQERLARVGQRRLSADRHRRRTAARRRASTSSSATR